MPVLYLWLPPHHWIHSQTDLNCCCTVFFFLLSLLLLFFCIDLTEWVWIAMGCSVSFALTHSVSSFSLSRSSRCSFVRSFACSFVRSLAQFSYTQFHIFAVYFFFVVNIVASLSLNNTPFSWCARLNRFITVVYSSIGAHTSNACLLVVRCIGFGVDFDVRNISFGWERRIKSIVYSYFIVNAR